MRQTVYEQDFIRQFRDMGRMDGWSAGGLRVLYEYLIELEEGMGVSEEIELDVIALCCAFAELTHEEACRDYCVESVEELRDQTTVLDVDDETVIVQSF